MPIVLPEATKKAAIEAIKAYFREERDEEIGDLQALFLLEFFLKTLGPDIYNQAIHDAQTYLQRLVTDLDLTLNQN